MREPVTKFDLAAAFKALDECEIPKVRGLRPNRINIKEATRKIEPTDSLIEEYYNVNDSADMRQAAEDRAAEVAKAKLARIEKIVDIDAQSEEDVRPSYVGKTIVQCPQCMTLYYRKPEDLVAVEGEDGVVNAGEQCPNCGYDEGFEVIGKVAAEEAPAEETPAEEAPEGEAPAEEAPEEAPAAPAEEPAEELPAADELPAEESEEEPQDEAPELEPVEETEEGEEDEKKDESLEVCEKCGKNPCECVKEEEKEPLNEDADLDKALDAHNEYIKYLQGQIEEEEKALAAAGNDEVKASIQRKIDVLKADLDAALPEAVKADVQTDELPAADEIPDEVAEEEPKEEAKESLKENAECKGDDCVDEKVCKVNKVITHPDDEKLFEDMLNEDGEISDAAIDALFDSEEFNTPISDAEVRGYLNGDASKESEPKEECLKEGSDVDHHQVSLDLKKKFDEVIRTWEDFDLEAAEDIDEDSLNEQMNRYFTEVYQNVDSFKATDCELTHGRLCIEGVIKFKSGKQKQTRFEFKAGKDNILEGYNKDIADGNAFRLHCHYQYTGKTIMTESLSYNYAVGEAMVSGSTK